MDIKQEKLTTTTKEQTTPVAEQKEYSLKLNNFNPMKGSPNLFMTKLEFRIRNYSIELELENDPLVL